MRFVRSAMGCSAVLFLFWLAYGVVWLILSAVGFILHLLMSNLITGILFMASIAVGGIWLMVKFIQVTRKNEEN